MKKNNFEGLTEGVKAVVAKMGKVVDLFRREEQETLNQAIYVSRNNDLGMDNPSYDFAVVECADGKRRFVYDDQFGELENNPQYANGFKDMKITNQGLEYQNSLVTEPITYNEFKKQFPDEYGVLIADNEEVPYSKAA